jgi:carbon monoxide dehydrogenase subunit G
MPKRAAVASATAMPSTARIQGSQVLHAAPADVWQQLLNPEVLQRCIPGCTAMAQTQPEHYQGTVKIGLGPVSATFATQVALFPEASDHATFPTRSRLVISGQAGALGEGQATVLVQLHAIEDARTRLDWQASPEVTGKLAQLGNRFMDATAHSLSQQFFNRFSAGLTGDTPSRATSFSTYALTNKVKQWFQRFFER